MLSPEILVNKLPIGFFINPLMIKTNPESNSEIATVDAIVGDRSKYSINLEEVKGICLNHEL